MNDEQMKQYRELKGKHQDRVLLFRCGDFYEAYEDDARVCADELGLTLTCQGGDGEHVMAAFPYRALDMYLPRLVRQGHRVVIVDQLAGVSAIRKAAKLITEKAFPEQEQAAKAEQSDARMQLCSQLAAIREGEGLTRTQLAERSGVGRSHIARIEDGTLNVCIDTLAALADALGCRITLEKKRRHPDVID